MHFTVLKALLHTETNACNQAIWLNPKWLLSHIEGIKHLKQPVIQLSFPAYDTEYILHTSIVLHSNNQKSVLYIDMFREYKW